MGRKMKNVAKVGRKVGKDRKLKKNISLNEDWILNQGVTLSRYIGADVDKLDGLSIPALPKCVLKVIGLHWLAVLINYRAKNALLTVLSTR